MRRSPHIADGRRRCREKNGRPGCRWRAWSMPSLADPASRRLLELLWTIHLVDPAPFTCLAHHHLGPREFEGNAAAAASEVGVDVAHQASSELHLASLDGLCPLRHRVAVSYWHHGVVMVTLRARSRRFR